jgi:hypothetical protein
MATLEQVYELSNLERAWRWILSNPIAAYKGYFRTLYANYGIASGELLKDLRDRLKRGVYEPAPACKLFLPKASGVLRTHSLLTVEDQVVYQAMVNIVADRLYPRVRERYFKEVFSHLYAGKSSLWFYKKWQSGYTAFNRAARQAFAEGFRFTANFDLTAFYDSVDHNVLCHFLSELRCGDDLKDLLRSCLSHWTSAEGTIFHNHGIPQGPLSSGLLGEVVLQHLDRNHRSPETIRYLRYVDDIRLFSRSLPDLRRMITWLDFLSKEVGLFPQSSKIHPHRVTDIEEELKSVSQPFDEVYDEEAGTIDQWLLRARLKEISPRGRVDDPTEFTFLLARAEPTAELNGRLWKVLENHPELYTSVLRYFQRYRILPPKSGDGLVAALKARPRFPSVVAELIRTAEGRLKPEQATEVDRFVKGSPVPSGVPSADLMAAVGRWGIQRKLLPTRQIERMVRGPAPWWTKAELLAVLDHCVLGKTTRDQLLNEKLRETVSDVAIAAAVHVAHPGGVRVRAPYSTVQIAAARILEAFGVLPEGTGRVCGIERYFKRLLSKQPPPIDWKSFFGRDYRRAERQAVLCSGLAQANVTAWVNAMDVFNDWLLRALFRLDKSLGGGYVIGKLGSIMGHGKLKTIYPATQALVIEIHEKRGESSLSHPVKKKGSVIVKLADIIKYRYIFRARKFIEKAIAELSTAAHANGWR